MIILNQWSCDLRFILTQLQLLILDLLNLQNLFTDLALLDLIPSEPKVTNLDVAIRVNQNIGRFKVPMHYIGWMQEIDSTQNIVKYDGDMALVELFHDLTLFEVEDLFQIILDKVHHYENMGQAFWTKFNWGRVKI